MTTTSAPTTFWLHFDRKRSAEVAAVALADWKPDFRFLIHQSEGFDGRWLLRATRNLGSRALEEHSDLIAHLVDHLGGEYDGWESGWFECTPETLAEFRALEPAA